MTGKRFAARLAAVQALYQMEQTGHGAKLARYELQQGNIGLDHDETALPNPDQKLFAIIIDGVIEHQMRIDDMIRRKLSDGWRMTRLNATSRAILRAAISELLVCPEQEIAVILDEYVSIAGGFSAGPETGFVNGLLASAADEARAGLEIDASALKPR